MTLNATLVTVSTLIRPLQPRLLVILFLLAVSHAAAAQPEDARAKLQALRATMQELQQELEKIKNTRSELLSELEASESRVGELNKKVESLKQELQQKQGELKQLQHDKESAQAEKKQQQQAAAEQLRMAYQLGQQSHLKLLLNQQDPASIARQVKYLDYIVSHRQQRISQFAETVARLQRLEPAIAAKVAGIAQRQSQLSHERARLREAQQQRRQTLAKLDASMADKDAELKALEQDRQQLQNLVSRVVAVSDELDFAAPEQPINQLKGRLPWPTQGRIVQSYGASRIAGKLNWQGLVIAANEGDPVLAVHSGRVVFSDYLRGHGLLIILDHGSGFLSLYAHNEALYKSLGDWVRGGEQIASVGASGGRERAGLYFELRYKGEPTNPQQWLKKA